MDFINEILKDKEIELIGKLESARRKKEDAQKIITDTSVIIQDLVEKIEILKEKRGVK